MKGVFKRGPAAKSMKAFKNLLEESFLSSSERSVSFGIDREALDVRRGGKKGWIKGIGGTSPEEVSTRSCPGDWIVVLERLVGGLVTAGSGSIQASFSVPRLKGLYAFIPSESYQKSRSR